MTDTPHHQPPATAPACMGGWCRLRERCARHLSADRRAPAERLCAPGARDQFAPLDLAPARAAA